MTIKKYLDDKYDHIEYNLCDTCKKLFFVEEVRAVGDAPLGTPCEICGEGDGVVKEAQGDTEAES